jgi:hypothetical protein
VVKIFQHRCNEASRERPVNFELDIWLDNQEWGRNFFVGHDLGSAHSHLSMLLSSKPYEAALVNIKQSLSIADLRELATYFVGHEYYFIDVPQPLVYHASKYGDLNIACRLSEYERRIFGPGIKAVWVDPLDNPGDLYFIEKHTISNYILGLKTIIVSPELHEPNHSYKTKEVWAWVKENTEWVYGVCTKHHKELEDFLNV